MAACKSDKNSSATISSITLGTVTTAALPIDDVEIRPPNALDWFAESMFFDSGAGVNGIRRDVVEKIGFGLGRRCEGRNLRREWRNHGLPGGGFRQHQVLGKYYSIDIFCVLY